MSEKKKLISVVVPVYNVEAYLRETLESVVWQSIGFRENVEIILVNDGSPDDSEAVCLEYKNRYPENVIYIKQKNAGVSVARNNGLKKARGRYVHFLDSDDLVSRNFYKEAVKFFEEHDAEVDLVACKIMYFEGSFSPHYLNWKYHKTRVLDLDKQPQASIYHLNSCVMKRSAIADLQFDKRLSISEDQKFLMQLLAKKKAYGALSKSATYYRKRKSGTSAIDRKITDKRYYLVPEIIYADEIKMWSDGKGNLHKFAQWEIMNDLRWKISEEESQDVLSKKAEQDYKKAIYKTLDYLDDEVLAGSALDCTTKQFLLRKKYGSNYEKKLSFKNGAYYIDDTLLLNVKKDKSACSTNFDFIHDLGDGQLKIEGYALNSPVSNRDKFYIKTSQGQFDLKPIERAQRQRGSFLGDQFSSDEEYESIIKVAKNDRIEYILETFTGEKISLPIFTKRQTGFGNLNRQYIVRANRLIRKENNQLFVHENNPQNLYKFEARFRLQIAKNWQLRRSAGMVKRLLNSNMKFIPKISIIKTVVIAVGLALRAMFFAVIDIFVRSFYFRAVDKKHQPIWLISDRGGVAGDNGEALFKYIAKNENPKADVYFVVDKKSVDYKRLKKIGKVLNLRSLKYKIKFLLAKNVISSHADDYVVNPFLYRWNHFCDLYNFNFVFLQHGIINQDMSDWLNRYNKNIKIFVTSTKRERASVLEYPYYYEPANVLLSGLPRYDLLTSDPKNKLILAPSWRANLLAENAKGMSGIRRRSETFKQTEYYKFYNGLMNDPRLLEALKNANMVGELYLHPAFSEQINDFVSNEYFYTKAFPYDYKTAFREGNILVTDLSSVAFDFSYLKKPIIYTLFDIDKIFDSHIQKKGYFEHKKDGFGPACPDYESSVKEIVKIIKNGCKMSPKYQKRVDNFFAFRDRKNCRRVYKGIVKL